MEIAYDSGATVILQGPCQYEIESARGGFLSLGKLTARVEKRAEGGGRRAEGEWAMGSGQWAVNPKSKIQNPKLSLAASASSSDQEAWGERTANLTFSPTGQAPTTSLAPRPSADASGQWPVASGQWEKSEIRNPKSLIPNP